MTDDDYYENDINDEFVKNFPPMSKFEDSDNKYLAKMIRYVGTSLNVRVEVHNRRIRELEKTKTYEEGIEEGRQSLVKWVTIVMSMIVGGASILYYLTSVVS